MLVICQAFFTLKFQQKMGPESWVLPSNLASASWTAVAIPQSGSDTALEGVAAIIPTAPPRTKAPSPLRSAGALQDAWRLLFVPIKNEAGISPGPA